MIYNGMCNNTKIDKTGRKIGKKSKELYILNVNDILNDFLTFFLLLNMSFYIFPNPPLPVYQIFTRRGNNQDKYNPGITADYDPNFIYKKSECTFFWRSELWLLFFQRGCDE